MRNNCSSNGSSDDLPRWASIAIALGVFVGVPLFTLPTFLDYAQEAKTLLLSIFTLLVLCSIMFWGKFRVLYATRTEIPRQLAMITSGLAAAAVLSAALSPGGLDLTHLHAIRNLLLPLIAAYLLTTTLKQRWILEGIAAGATVIGILGIAQVAFDIHLLTPASDAGQFPGVSFGNRGLASAFVGLGIVPSLFLLREARAKGRGLLALAIAAQALFLGLALTRSTILATILTTSAWAIVDRTTGLGPKAVTPRRKLLPAAMALLVFGAAIFAWMFNDNLRSLVVLRLSPENWLQNPRLALWKICFDRLKDADLLRVAIGFGPGSFQALAQDWVKTSKIASLVFTAAHNDYLQMLLEYGLCGMLLWLAIPIAAFRKAFESPDLLGIRLVFAANILALLLVATLFYPFQIPFFSFLFWVFIFAMSQSEPLQHRRRTTGLLPRLAIAWVAVAGASLLGAEVYGRTLLESELRTYVATQEPYLMKRWRQKKIDRLLQWVPAPAHYRTIIDGAHLHKAAPPQT